MDITNEGQDWCKSVETVAREYGIPMAEFSIERLAEASYTPVPQLMCLWYVRDWLTRQGLWESYIERAVAGEFTTLRELLE